MAEQMDVGRVAVKLEPQETEHFNYDTTNISIEHNITTDTSIEPWEDTTIERKPVICVGGESNGTLFSYINEPDSVRGSEPSEPSNIECNNNTSETFRYQIEPKIEVEDEIVLPFSLLTADSSIGEFINELNYASCQFGPKSPEHECNSVSDEDLGRRRHEDELLMRSHQINECFVSVERLRYVPQLSSDQNTSHKCSYCSKVFGVAKYLLRHEKCHTDRVACDYCDKDFGSKYSLLTHIQSKHSGLSFNCSVCDKKLSCRLSLRMHMGVHTKPHKCEHCDLSFAFKSVLDNHIASHLGIKFQCDECPSWFGSIAYLNSHKYHHEHSKQVPTSSGFKCNFCEKRYVRNDRLRIHVKEAHGDPKGFAFRCEFCEATFATAIRYRLHRRRVHINPRRRINGKHKCAICKTAFHFRRQLKLHQEEHATVKKHECPECGGYFSTVYNVTCHRKSHKRRNAAAAEYTCDTCQKKFTSKQGLAYHLLEQHIQEKRFQCNPCNRFFASKRKLNEHLTTHGHNALQEQRMLSLACI